MDKNTNYLRRYKEIIEELSKKHNVSIQDIEFMIDFFFITFKRFITNIWMPTIRITNLGTFRPTLGRLDWHIAIKIKYLRKGVKDPDKVRVKLRHYLVVRKRLWNEKLGHNTWKEWKSKLKDDSQKEVQKPRP
jgi:hypothetical protein